MPRIARREMEGEYFHVMVQGIGKEFVFPDDNTRGYFLTSVQMAKERVPAKVIGFCVMGNHAHLLLKVSGVEELSKFMHFVNSEYSRYYNRVNNRAGYVFRNRYKSEVIKDVTQLCYCLAYIQNNPLKARMVEKAEDYAYSSYINYLTKRGIVDFDAAAEHFDVSPDNIREIMDSRTDYSWIEHDDRELANKYDALTLLKEKYDIYGTAFDEKVICPLILEIKEKSGLSLREIASFLNLNREKLRKAMSRYTSL